MNSLKELHLSLQVLKLFLQSNADSSGSINILAGKTAIHFTQFYLKEFVIGAVKPMMKLLSYVKQEFKLELDITRITNELTGLKTSMSCSAFFLASSASSYLALTISSCVTMASLAATARSFRKELCVIVT